ncbi:MAG: hypothetical protein QOC63_3123 [Mycobacterium sp.]|jgi:hypothetical protein|nr:hypothetical protein [Mycobacterium sp.]
MGEAFEKPIDFGGWVFGLATGLFGAGLINRLATMPISDGCQPHYSGPLSGFHSTLPNCNFLGMPANEGLSPVGTFIAGCVIAVLAFVAFVAFRKWNESRS